MRKVYLLIFALLSFGIGKGKALHNSKTLLTHYPSCTLTSTAKTDTNATCNGGNNGSATVTASSGTLPYTYLWSPNGGSDSTATGLSAGNYTVTVTDANGCTSTNSIVITQPNPITAKIQTIAGNSCSSLPYGSATVDSVSGGTPPYKYTWEDGEHGTNWHYGQLGSDSLLIADTNGCTAYFHFTIADSGYMPKIDSIVVTSWPDTGGGTGGACFHFYSKGAHTTYFINSSPYNADTDCISNITGPDTLCIIVNATDGPNCISPNDTVCVFIPLKLITGNGKIYALVPEINVFPNPNNGHFIVVFSKAVCQQADLTSQVALEIYNVMGQKVNISTLTQFQGGFEIDLGAQPPGVYFYRAVKADGTLIGEGKFVIQK